MSETANRRPRVIPGLIATALTAGILTAAAPAHADSHQALTTAPTSTGALGKGAAPGEAVTRQQVIARAQTWVDLKVPYSTNGLRSPYSWWSDHATGGRYRQDCSGYVSMAWQLPTSLTTRSLPGVSKKIPVSSLQPGDILNSSDHVIIFAGWVNHSQGTFSYYQQSSPGTAATKTTGSLNSSVLAGHPVSTYAARQYHRVTAPPRSPKPTSSSTAPKPSSAPRTPAPPNPATTTTHTRTIATIAVTPDNRLYALARNHSAVYQWTGKGTAWKRIGGPASKIYAAGGGLFATGPNNGPIFRYNGSPGSWTRIGGPGHTFAISNNHLYGLTPKRDAVYQWTGKGTTWTRVGGPASKIYAAGGGLFATNPNDGRIFRYSGIPGSWTRIGGPGHTFAISNNHLYGLTPNHSAVYQWTGRATIWTRIAGPLPR
ncbi:hypothetical protein ACFV2X_25420 [Streptomyces sp. NPDC059679]|uniref:hypothetical protein n=1 Tax=Streptomyces sp. NPDC059679 TaxID=3346903 RepID=UPI00368482E5